MEMAKIFEELLVENELELLVSNTDFHSSRTQLSIRRMLLRRVDGVAFMCSEKEGATLESLVQNRIPVVTTDHHRTAPGISDIIVDFRDGMAQIVRHLKELGHRHIGFIGGTDDLATSRDRRDSFLDAVVKFGLSSQDSWIVAGDFKIAGGARGVESILNQEMRPTAVVTANDLTAFGALRKIHEMGLRIPEDISLTGCDDIEMSDVVYPPLTTLRISRRQYAQMLFDALQMGASDPSQTGRVFSLPMKLVVRQSTGPAPSGDRRNRAGMAARLPEEHVKEKEQATETDSGRDCRPLDQDWLHREAVVDAHALSNRAAYRSQQRVPASQPRTPGSRRRSWLTSDCHSEGRGPGQESGA